MNNDLELYHSLLAEIESLSKKLKSERVKKSRYKSRCKELQTSKRSFGAQVVLNLIHRRATTHPELTLADISKQTGVAYSYVKTLNSRYTNGQIND